MKNDDFGESTGRDPVTIATACTVLHETHKAILVRGEGISDKMWVPKAALHDDSEVYAKGTDGDLVVYAWFAEKEGLA